MKTLGLAAVFAISMMGMAHSAVQTDPDWPCVQRKQPALSVAQVWPGPAIPDPPPQADAKIAELAQRIALRRTPLDEATQLIEAFKANNPPEAQIALFLATFDQIQTARNRVIAGIARYAHKQLALEQEINQKRHLFAELSEAQPPDYDAIDKAEAEVDWATRVFVDRKQSLTYVCETPVFLEQRIFALGRALAAGL